MLYVMCSSDMMLLISRVFALWEVPVDMAGIFLLEQ